MDSQRLRQYAEERWFNLGDTATLAVSDPVLARALFSSNPAEELLWQMSQPENFGWTCRHLLGRDLAPFQLAVLRELWVRPFPMLIATRGGSKSWILAVYSLLRALFCQGSKIVVVGAAFRQAKAVFEYCEDLWNSAAIYRDIVGRGTKSRANGPSRETDRCRLRVGDSTITALPLGNGEKIRSQRATHLIGEEFASIPVEIFETSVSGFAAVSADPVERMKLFHRALALQEMGVEGAEELLGAVSSNQTILSGTAYYSFNHFYAYWKRYKAIIESRGDRKVLEELFGGRVPEKLNWKDFSVIRLPYELIPVGFMDEKTVDKQRATVNSSVYLTEYNACFASDSNGFFKRSLIESCVVGKPDSPVFHPSSGEIHFTATLTGHPRRRYVLGVDPASEQDNFSIVILEIWPDHRRIVYCWTTTRKAHRARLVRKLAEENDFYGFAARKIRELARAFPCERIALDAQGGGIAVMEALRVNLREGEVPFLPVVDPNCPQDSDCLMGEHLLELVQFARSDWVSEANHGMKKDLESKLLLFPEFNPAVVGLAAEEDRMTGRVALDARGEEEQLYDTLEDCVLEIEELKDELASIELRSAGVSGRERWDTPEVKTPGGKKGRLRKDRYSALLMANMVARQLTQRQDIYLPSCTGGFARDLAATPPRRGGPAYTHAPDWWQQNIRAHQGQYGVVVHRKRQ